MESNHPHVRNLIRLSPSAIGRSWLDEQRRALKVLHHIRIVPALINDLITLLHINCGTGAFTHEMATACPEATFYRVNSSFAPRIMPSNTDVIIGSALELAGKAPSTHSTADLIYHGSLLYGMIYWQDYVAAAASLVKPGGYIEVHNIMLAILQRRRHSKR